MELEFFAMRAKYERAQADLQAQEDARDASRSHARETTEMLQEKNREVEWLRAQKAVDDVSGLFRNIVRTRRSHLCPTARAGGESETAHGQGVMLMLCSFGPIQEFHWVCSFSLLLLGGYGGILYYTWRDGKHVLAIAMS